MISVSIVEDNYPISKSLEMLIGGSEGFSVAGVCANCDEAVKKIPVWKPDVVLMDINLGHGSADGIECIRKLKQADYSGQFMMCTVYENDDKIFEALKAGATGYILKKSSPLEILQSITELYNGGSPMSSEIARRVVNFFMKPEQKIPEQKKDLNEENFSLLTEREKEILTSLSEGLLYKEIADYFHISIDTVRRHVHNIYSKLQVNNRTEAINRIYKFR